MENHGHEEQGTSAMDHQEARKHTLERQVESTGALQESRNWSMGCLLYTSPSPRDQRGSRMPSSA